MALFLSPAKPASNANHCTSDGLRRDDVAVAPTTMPADARLGSRLSTSLCISNARLACRNAPVTLPSIEAM